MNTNSRTSKILLDDKCYNSNNIQINYSGFIFICIFLFGLITSWASYPIKYTPFSSEMSILGVYKLNNDTFNTLSMVIFSSTMIFLGIWVLIWYCTNNKYLQINYIFIGIGFMLIAIPCVIDPFRLHLIGAIFVCSFIFIGLLIEKNIKNIPSIMALIGSLSFTIYIILKICGITIGIFQWIGIFNVIFYLSFRLSDNCSCK